MFSKVLIRKFSTNYAQTLGKSLFNNTKLCRKNLYSAVLSTFEGKTEKTSIQLIRYTFVGGLAFIVDFATLFLLTDFFNLHYLLSGAIAFMLGLLTNYFISVKWVFYNRSIEKKYLEFILFALIGIVGLGLNELFLWVFTGLVSLYYLLSKIITTIIVYFWNFFARKYLLFSSPDHSK